jgi:hypothetical protein
MFALPLRNIHEDFEAKVPGKPHGYCVVVLFSLIHSPSSFAQPSMRGAAG